MLLMAFQTSEGPETHIITKLESNPNLREGGSTGHLHQIKGGSTGEGGGLLSVYLLIADFEFLFEISKKYKFSKT